MSMTISKQKKRKLIILPNVEDIIHFKSAGKDKATNDQLNKIREDIITNMYHFNSDYFEDSTYGNDWCILYEKFNTKIATLCDIPYKRVSIKHMGGMTYNYDFLLSYYDTTETIIKEVKLEFKHNNSDVSELVQFLELYDKDCKTKFNICHVSYAEYYYDNYLKNYMNCDENLIIPIPDRDEYLKNVYDIKYKHPFFQHLQENKTNQKKEKQQVANDSVKSYIQNFVTNFKFDKIVDKIKESQTNKVFLLWDCENFHIQSVDTNKLGIKGIKKIDSLYFDLETENFQYDIRIRLNWGNTNGISNPRWKFTFINKLAKFVQVLF
jgi:hypothetical protein